MRVRQESEVFPDWYWPPVSSKEFTVNQDGTKTWTDGTSWPEATTSSWCSGSKEMHDVVTPRFKQRVAKGEIINNPMLQKMQSVEDSQMLISLNWDNFDSNGKLISGVVREGPTRWAASLSLKAEEHPPLEINTESVTSRAVSQAHANCDLSEAAILATVGELDSTVKGLAQILRRCYGIFRSVRKLDVLALKGQIKPRELADRYMEYRYALRPLYYDAQQLTSAFKTNHTIGSRQTFRGFAEDSVEDSGTYTHEYDNKTHTVSWTSKRTFTARAGVLCCITDDSKDLVFGARNVPQSMWELVPFSFIVDWFWNVGNIISSFSPKVGLDELASWVVTTDVTSFTANVSLSDYENPSKTTKWYVGGSGDYFSNTLEKTRIVNPARGILPRLNVRLDPWKLLDLHIILNNMRK